MDFKTPGGNNVKITSPVYTHIFQVDWMAYIVCSLGALSIKLIAEKNNKSIENGTSNWL